MLLFACILAVVISFAFTFPIRKYIAPKLGFMDHPKDGRRMHTEAKPLIGGLSVYVAFSVSSLVFGYGETALPFILGGGLIVLCGMADDRFSIKPIYKLICQALAGVLLCFFDVTVEHLCVFNTVIDLGILKYPMTVLWVVAVTNAFNLIDGLDGLCTGLSIISSGGVGLLALANGHSEVFVCAMILMCAALGFLVHNVYPARIFLGDTGAMFFGFVLAAMSMEVTYVSDTKIPSIVVITLIGLPVFDTTYAIIRRICRKKHIMEGDKEHIHHVLCRSHSQPVTVALMYLAAVVCVGISLIMTGGTSGEAIGYVLAAAAVAYGIYRFGVLGKCAAGDGESDCDAAAADAEAETEERADEGKAGQAKSDAVNDAKADVEN
ncbi:MAG: undecaprenyl/decaprenyl-phosphate alpha-N-acetylglucosaminyl 1-phosphate transferase [Clostridia bacterium]|nr:undecaprenyl/decaprenyl-phosphate alpha-N-acetylglucosaminyl 1-phosphate transferase [Clostridia bacterium]